ncbi:MAG: vitamin B12-dependent ribonucleotide reductase, partial [candidate division NC10 bacterium]|nr:vitamin B12-dependent ribonucleotide reductase [candidate division NC10 bacterium]
MKNIAARKSRAGRLNARKPLPAPAFSENAIVVLQRRYLKKDEKGRPTETPTDMLWRVAKNIAAVDSRYGRSRAQVAAVEREFYELMASLDFLPNSPTLMNAGRDLQQLSACFVLPVEDSIEGIFDAIKYTALIHKSGGGTGFTFSHLRPKGDRVATTQGLASGPISFLKVFNAATEAVKQGGTRRGANMGILRVDHPDILEFITCKEKEDSITNFNISVGLSEAFMQALEKDKEYDLIDPRTGKPRGKLRAREVFNLIIQMAWKNGEPGIVFLDRLDAGNPTPKLGVIESTNPCGEQPLLPYESCNLGSINLANMVKEGKIDYDRLRRGVHSAVHFLDNVIDANRYPLPQIEEMTKGNRKIGLGVMGFADLLIRLGIPYDTKEAIALGEKLMAFIRKEAEKASVDLAKERGVFPNFKGSIYDRPRGPRLRNATLTTIAPTGTISMIAGTSSGIEPLFAVAFQKHVLDNDTLTEVNPLFEEIAKRNGFYTPELMARISKTGSVHGLKEVPPSIQRLFVTAHDISPEWHIRMQAAFQKYTDNAVSKTVNFPESATVQDVEEVYRLAYQLGCKGVTIYRDKSREVQVMTKGAEREAAPPPRISPRRRPQELQGKTIEMTTGCGKLYVTVNADEKGPFEVFASLGKAGGCAAAQTEATARLASQALRAGIDPEIIVKQLKGIRCHIPSGLGEQEILSCADAIGKALEYYLHAAQLPLPYTYEANRASASGQVPAGSPATVASSGVRLQALNASSGRGKSESKHPKNNFKGACPECGSSALQFEEGCFTCR